MRRAHPFAVTRRSFCAGAAAVGLSGAFRVPCLAAQTPGGSDLRPDVAAIDHDRILRAADGFLAGRPTPVTELHSPLSPGGPHDYFSELPEAPAAGQEDSAPDAGPHPYTAQRDALFELGLRVPCLAAAQWLTRDAKYGDAAARHLRAWFVDPMTRMNPALDYAGVPMAGASEAAAPATSNREGDGQQAGQKPRSGTYAGVIEALPLVEVVQSIPFLAAAGSLSDSDSMALRKWFGDYLHWLTAEQDSGPRIAALARDHKDHHATSWTLQAAAFTLFTAPDTGAPKNEDRGMTELRHRFRSVTLRTQIASDGMFRNEISTPNPYRNSLFNLDMLACLCHLLSTRFESVWDYELADGPGMRVAVAYHFPFIQNRAKWPYRADSRFFTDLPGRRPSLLFASRPYQRPEYAALWKSLEPDPGPVEIERTIPVHQPLLWLVQPRRPAPGPLGV